MKEYKNLYYVEEITKKIFILLFFHEKKMKEEIKNDIQDIYDFKKYYLINSKWLKEYKEYFLYETIIKKLNKFKYKDYSYNRIKIEFNNISKQDIGQIQLYSDTKISEYLRDASNLIFENKEIESKIINNEYPSQSHEFNYYNTPEEFELINKDIYELLKKEEFFYNMNKNIKNSLSYEVLLGNNQIIKLKIKKKKKKIIYLII
jgi:hypothetical protein